MNGNCTNTGLPGLIATARQQTVRVLRNEQIAEDTWVMRLECPDIASQILPGQFFMIRPQSGSDPLLGRPFALYNVFENPNGEKTAIDFGYLVIGKLTSLMTQWQIGEAVEVWGPLGNGFPEPGGEHLMCVAGGIGQTPFLAVAREALGLQAYGEVPRKPAILPRRVSLAYGVRSSHFLAGVDEFRMPGLNLELATDDGTAGHHGYVTELLQQALDGSDPPDRVFCCGPEPMMHAVATLCEQRKVACWLSLESPMACGIGICFSCVTRVRDEEGWDYRRTCVEGPVFRASDLVWDDPAA